MAELTVKQLKLHIEYMLKVQPEIANKKILISDDEEGNGFHGLYFGLNLDVSSFQDVIYDIEEEELDHYVILG